MRALTTDEGVGHGQHACTWHEFGERIARPHVLVSVCIMLSPSYQHHVSMNKTAHSFAISRHTQVACRACGRRERRLAPTWSYSYMPPVDYLSPEGLRVDGRRPNEARLLRCRMGAQAASVDGSCYFEQGHTKVLVSVCGPKEASKRKTDGARGMLHCDFTSLPFATGEHRPQSHGDRSATGNGCSTAQNL